MTKISRKVFVVTVLFFRRLQQMGLHFDFFYKYLCINILHIAYSIHIYLCINILHIAYFQTSTTPTAASGATVSIFQSLAPTGQGYQRLVSWFLCFFLISDCLWINRQSNLCKPSKNLYSLSSLPSVRSSEAIFWGWNVPATPTGVNLLECHPRKFNIVPHLPFNSWMLLLSHLNRLLIAAHGNGHLGFLVNRRKE